MTSFWSAVNVMDRSARGRRRYLNDDCGLVVSSSLKAMPTQKMERVFQVKVVNVPSKVQQKETAGFGDALAPLRFPGSRWDVHAM